MSNPKVVFSEDRQRFPDAIFFTADLSDFDLMFSGQQATPQHPSYGSLSEEIFGCPFLTASRFGFDPLISAEVDIAEHERQKTEEAFSALYDQWRTERGTTSSITEMVMCKAYLQIIALGPRVIPIILRRMEDQGAEPDMWFVALQILTGADPVTDEIRGDFGAMARRWLDWAAANGYAW
jgi:hypothetical protein